jgi:copper resistance protein B
MFTKQVLIFVNMMLLASLSMASGEHEAAVFHAATLEVSGGENRDNESWRDWDLDGWIGTDNHKLWIKSEGHEVDHQTESSENWLLYSHNVATFWDAQIGLRDDSRPESTSYLVAGFNGLAPYYFETQAHVFVSQKGDVSFRVREENDFLFTQKLIFQPYVEVNIFAQEVKELNTGSGLSEASIGLQLRYEITRKFAPYLEVSYEKLYGDTADIAVAAGENRSDSAVTAGFRVMF